MPVSEAQKTILVLGGTSRVARLLRACWNSNVPEKLRIFWVGREPGPGIDHVWQPGENVDSLPQCNIVLALWGTISGIEEELRANISLAHEAHRVARELGAGHVFHASSVAVYRPTAQIIDENAPCDPRNPYGRSKLAMEHAVSGETPRATCLRMANVVGADSLFNALSKDGTMTVDAFEDGTGPRRSYLRPSTMARVIETLAGSPVDALPPVLNLADRGLVDMADIVTCAGRPMIRPQAPPDALPVMEIDVSRLERVLGQPLEHVEAADLFAEWQQVRSTE